MEKLPSALQHVYTIVLVMFGWVLFFSPSLGSAVSYMGTMLGIGGAGLADLTGWYYLKSGLVLGIIAAVGSTPVVYRRFSKWEHSRNPYKQIACVVVYAGIFLYLDGISGQCNV